jgi:transposase InsO family protein
MRWSHAECADPELLEQFGSVAAVPADLEPRSDHVPQYASGGYQGLLTAHGLVGSTRRRGNCWDSALAESFFATYKLDLIERRSWPTRARARMATVHWMKLSTTASAGTQPST